MRTTLTAVACSLLGTAQAQVVQQAKLIPEGVTQGDIFGYSLEFDGTTMVVGAAFDDAPQSNAGAVYPVRLVGGEWVSEGRLIASDPQADASLGDCVAVSGDIILSGAPLHDGLGNASGVAYVFERFGGVWAQTGRFFGSGTGSGHHFGASVAMGGDSAYIVANGEPSGAEGFGVVYEFRKSGGVWRETQRFEADAAPFARVAIGTDIDVDDDVMVVGGSSSQPNLVVGAGAAFVFERVGGAWAHTATLTASTLQENEHFGVAVSVSGGTIVVGADDYDEGGRNNGGAIYTFVRDAEGWSPLGRTVPADNADGDNFGVALELEGEVLAVGAYLDDDRGDGAGKVYLFDLVGGAWRERERFTGDDTNEGDLFGWALGLAQGRVAVAAPYENSRGLQSGAAYVFGGAGPLCVADFDGDGTVDTRDVIAFLGAWSAGRGDADIDGDGTIDTRDVVAFLDAWAGGC